MRVTPLRLCAFLVLAAALLVTGWLALWTFVVPARLSDPYYYAASGRALIPFPATVAAIALIVALAARSGMVKRRLAAAGLWAILAGAMFLLIGIAIEYRFASAWTYPRRLQDLDTHLAYVRMVMLAMTGAVILMPLGIVLWLIARFTGKPRDPA